MRNKGVIVVLTIIITALCLFYLSFTFIAQQVQQKAIAYATDKNKAVDLTKKQFYLDSVWNQPVYNLFWKNYTYKEVKENELSLGLDLQGGMHVVLEISPVDIIKGLSNNNQDPAFLAALKKAGLTKNSSPENFVSLFSKAYKEANPDKKLAPLFASSTTKDRVSLSDSDDAVVKFLNTEIKSAIDRSYTILKTRMSQFGTSEPSVQQLQSTGQIQIEIPGADNPQRVRKLLQGVARLEFWEVVEPNEPSLNRALFAINQMLLKEKVKKTVVVKNTIPKKESLAKALGADAKSDTTKSALEKELSKATADSAGNSLDSLTRNTLSPLFALSNPSIPFLYATKDTSEINRIFKRPEVQALWPRTIGRFWDVKSET